MIWDQEVFDTWTYNQDRTFFHTFELEECVAGLSFVDEKEAALFLKKMQNREKHASRATRQTPFGGNGQPAQHKHGFLGLGGIFGGHRHSSAPTPPDSPGHNNHVSSGSTSDLSKMSEFALLDAFDPRWRENFGHYLKEQGLNDDFIKDNQEFIVDFLREEQEKMKQQDQQAKPPATNGNDAGRSARPPPPPPPPVSESRPAELPGSGSRRNVPPAPPPPRRPGKPEVHREPSPSESPPPPQPPRAKYNAPPPLADAGRYANTERTRKTPAAPAAPAPPPRPPKTPMGGQATPSAPPPPPARNVPPAPSRGSVPPPPPPRETTQSPPSQPEAPPLPPKAPMVPPPSTRPPMPAPSAPSPPPSSSAPPPPPPRPAADSPPPPPAPAPRAAPTSPPAPPPPPPGPAPTLSKAPASSPPPAPPLPPPTASQAPPAPPPPPPAPHAPPPPDRDSGYSSGVPPAASDPSRAGLLDSIHKAGGIGSLKKVDKNEIRDRSAVGVGGSGTGPHGSGLPPSGVAPGGQAPMADALAAALQKRKEKVSKSGEFWPLRLSPGRFTVANELQMMKIVTMVGKEVLFGWLVWSLVRWSLMRGR